MACSNDCCSINEDDTKNIKCPNFLLCESYESQEILDDNNGLCVYCNIICGKLEFELDKQCIICLQHNKTSVCFDPKCNHHICVTCYKVKYIFDEDDDNQNIFKICSICNVK